MAKKTLTPEQAEIKALKKAKKSENWTKFWAIVLAAVLTFGVVALGKSQADTALANAGADTSVNSDANVDSDNVDDSGDDMFADDNSSSDNSASDNSASDNTSSDNTASDNNASNNNTNNNTNNNSNTNNNTSNNNQQQSNQPSKAEVAKALNDATAKASKASYDWTRSAKFTKNIDVGGLTSILDGIIKAVDENASLNSVVGGFLGIKEQPLEAKVANGQLPEEGMGDDKYLLKAMTLTENDIQSYKVDGNKYQVQIKNCTNPDENSSLAHATNDYITFAEVNESIASAVGDKVKVLEDGSKANYKKILFTVVIEDGKITSLEYSYTFEANIQIKAGLTAAGTGAAEMNAKYSNFKY